MIIPLALRIAASRALIGRTLAGDLVKDSAIDALEDLAKATPVPFIVVSTDDQVYDLTNLDITGGTRRQDIVFDIAVASGVPIDGGGVSVVIPHTDAGIELSVNFITRQIMRALFEPASGGEWGTVFRAIVLRTTRMVIRRGAGSKDGTRFAAAQVVLSVETIAEPEFGRPPRNVWAQFITALRNDEGVENLAPAIEAQIIGEDIPDWRAWSSQIGIDDATGMAIGIVPLGGGDSVAAQEGTILPDGWSLTRDGGRAQLPEEFPIEEPALADQDGQPIADDWNLIIADSEDAP